MSRPALLLSGFLAVASAAIAVYLLRTNATSAIEGLPEKRRALAVERTAGRASEGVRSIPQYWQMPWAAQMAAIGSCHQSGGSKPMRDCLFDDADALEEHLAQRRVRRDLGWVAFGVTCASLVASAVALRRTRRDDALHDDAA